MSDRGDTLIMAGTWYGLAIGKDKPQQIKRCREFLLKCMDEFTQPLAEDDRKALNLFVMRIAQANKRDWNRVAELNTHGALSRVLKVYGYKPKQADA